jgi:hypothetical protein
MASEVERRSMLSPEAGFGPSELGLAPWTSKLLRKSSFPANVSPKIFSRLINYDDSPELRTMLCQQKGTGPTATNDAS